MRGVRQVDRRRSRAELLAPSSACASKASRTPARCPRRSAPRGHAEAHAVEALGGAAARSARAAPSEVESHGSSPDHVREQQRGVGDVAGERARLVERRREGDHAVARHRAVRRLEADDRRTARRAGGSSRRCRCRAPTGRGRRRPRRRCRPRSRPGTRVAVPRVAHRRRSRSSRSTSPSRTRPGSSCRAAPRRRPCELAHRGRRVRRPVALEDARAGLARHALGAEEVLDGERHAAQRAVGRRRARRASSATQVNALSVVGRAARSR